MAGYAIGGLVEKKSAGISFKDNVVKNYRDKQAEQRTEAKQLSGDYLQTMQRPEVRAVNRNEGCPAGKLVRLASRILLDCLNAETA